MAIALRRDAQCGKERDKVHNMSRIASPVLRHLPLKESPETSHVMHDRVARGIQGYSQTVSYPAGRTVVGHGGP
jgi:hypothetical protein